ncbi:MAG: triose-phosphate isomerase [Deltaproteobacteria bacterium]|nr:triose-phosphate isomerase [Deltaproteobacteria bacterium]
MTPLIAGNWKMNTTVHQGAELVIRLRELLKGIDTVDVVLAPPFTSIHHLSHLVADSPIKLAGQNFFWEKSGAYTGEVSAEMLLSAGCQYVIIGHSERRTHFKESDEEVNRKTLAALKSGLRPIICVGESLEERERGKTVKRVSSQLQNALSGVAGSAIREVTVAYEPVWAIGTGRNATPEQAEEVHNSLRDLLYEMYGPDAVKDVRIIYGGSVKPDNIDSLMAQPNIDGALVGGASLKAEDFARIVKFQPM